TTTGHPLAGAWQPSKPLARTPALPFGGTDVRHGRFRHQERAFAGPDPAGAALSGRYLRGDRIDPRHGDAGHHWSWPLKTLPPHCPIAHHGIDTTTWMHAHGKRDFHPATLAAARDVRTHRGGPGADDLAAARQPTGDRRRGIGDPGPPGRA